MCALLTRTREKGNEMGAHLVDGEFQSDKYPTTPRGKVPLSVKDTTAQDLLWEYAHSPTRCLRVVAPCTSKAAYVEMRELQGDERCKRCGQYCPGRRLGCSE